MKEVDILLLISGLYALVYSIILTLACLVLTSGYLASYFNLKFASFRLHYTYL